MREARQNLRASFLAALCACALSAGVALAQFRNPDFQPRDFISITNYSHISAIAASSQFAYFASGSNVIRYDIFADAWAEPLSGYTGLGGREIRDLAVSFDDERVWAQTENGVFVWERVFGRWSPAGEIPADARRGRYVNPAPLYVMPAGWVSFGAGLFMDSHLRRFNATLLYEDENGFVWMAIDGVGPAKSVANNNAFTLLPFGILQEWTTALAKVGNELIIGGTPLTETRAGLTILDLKNGSTRYFEQGVKRDFPRMTVNTVSANRDRIYVGSAEWGVFALDRENGEVQERYDKLSGLPDDEVLCLVSLGDTTLVGTRYGLGIIMPDSGEANGRFVSLQTLASERIYALEPDAPRGKRRLPGEQTRFVYIGGERGAYRLDLATLKSQKLTSPDVLVLGAVRDLYRSGSDLWLLSDGGLARLNVKSGETESFVEISRLSGVTAVVANENFVGIGSRSGLDIIYLTERLRTRRSYSTSDGLPSNSVTGLELAGDYLWVATDRGLSRFWWNNPYRTE